MLTVDGRLFLKRSQAVGLLSLAPGSTYSDEGC
ncbi:hypothetical protein OOU_Y34scaffold00414g15 [Pyricularia oryzae Y34]|uniref:Uncharacterized protein n=2 Tax=Pyricularia oryzae TaxID=318829 RepID=A0AA97P256_PYRO3|nr:hypothetical protein OOU_Y34scaffold00414g15 [Pyricularia oryzae Y34]